MRGCCLIILLIFLPLLSFCQRNGLIKGSLVDTSQKIHLSFATVSVLQKSDSSFVNFTIADKKGIFEIRNLGTGDYILFISFNGYQNHKIDFSITKEKKEFDAGEIVMQKKFKTLDGVTVSDAFPVRMNGDTLSFKASAFNARHDATV